MEVGRVARPTGAHPIPEEAVMGRNRLRALMMSLVVTAGILGLGLAVLMRAFPHGQSASREVIQPTAERLARGRYLVEKVANCLDCHSQRDWSRLGGPVVAGTEGQGAPFSVLGPPVHSADITSAALSHWTDGEIARALTSGIGRDGNAVHPFMPHDAYSRLDAEDVRSVVVYLRALPPIDHSVPRTREKWPIRLLGRLLSKPHVSPEPVDRRDSVAYGRYLVTIAECRLCHGDDLSGGRTFRIPGTEATEDSANITPHPSALPGQWSRENFVALFKSLDTEEAIEVPPGQVNTVMPWARLAGLSEADLGAIYDYLQTVPPVETP
jgi:mono/diheme cytochrome c family protein